MRRFNSEMAAYLRDELGCKQLINANNWRTVDMVMTQDAEYWADSANEVIGRNFYTGGYHQGVNDGWQILRGPLLHRRLDDPRAGRPAHEREAAAGPPVHPPRDAVGAARSLRVGRAADGGRANRPGRA